MQSTVQNNWFTFAIVAFKEVITTPRHLQKHTTPYQDAKKCHGAERQWTPARAWHLLTMGSHTITTRIISSVSIVELWRIMQISATRPARMRRTMIKTPVMMVVLKAKSNIPQTWILLDNQSTIDLFCSLDLLINIRESQSSMKVHCNAGSRVTNMVGDLQGYGTVWYDPMEIANILSFKRVSEKYVAAYDQAE